MAIAGVARVPFEADFSALNAAVTRSVESASTKFKSLVPVAAMGAAIAGIGGIAVDPAMEFRTSLLQIEARMGITARQGASIGDAFLSTAGKSTFSANTIAAAFAPVAGHLDTINKG